MNAGLVVRHRVVLQAMAFPEFGIAVALSARARNVPAEDAALRVVGLPNFVDAVTIDADRHALVPLGELHPVERELVERVLIRRQVVEPHPRRVGVARCAERRNVAASRLAAEPGAVRARHAEGVGIPAVTRGARDAFALVHALLELDADVGVADAAHLRALRGLRAGRDRARGRNGLLTRPRRGRGGGGRSRGDGAGRSRDCRSRRSRRSRDGRRRGRLRRIGRLRESGRREQRRDEERPGRIPTPRSLHRRTSMYQPAQVRIAQAARSAIPA
jgi:hypothetical protein